MQNCFRAHPEVYADGTPYFVILYHPFDCQIFPLEIMNDDDDEEAIPANSANVPPAERSESEGKLSSDASLSPEKPRLDSAQAAKDSS